MDMCLSCQQSVEWNGEHYVCLSCKKHYVRQADCPDCDHQLEKLQACGSESYFCHHCNALKSKSRVRRYLVELTA